MSDEPMNHSRSEVGRSDAVEVLASVAEALKGLRFGQVTIAVHEGQVVQIERMERTRFPKRSE